MSSDSVIDLPGWVQGAPDAGTRELRQAVHTVLAAVAAAPRLPRLIVLKGGILLAIQYRGDRFTRDVDFSMKETVEQVDVASVVEELRAALALQVEQLPYGLDCRIQRHELRPRDPSRSWQTLQISVGFAPKADAARHRRLLAAGATSTLQIDISYNEAITAFEVLEIPEGGSFRASSLADVVAEKFRAMLQQSVRNRIRRQDAYDLYRLMNRPELADMEFRSKVLQALREKSAARKLAIGRDSLANEDVRRRSREEYPQLQAEIASELPDFEVVYGAVCQYYEALPW